MCARKSDLVSISLPLQTYNTDKQVPDSAGTATALFSAVKTKYGVIGLDSSAPKNRMDVGQIDGIMTWAQKQGKRTGFVTTTRITHATPAALYAHTPNRDAESDSGVLEGQSIIDIAKQLVESQPGNKINVSVGWVCITVLYNSQFAGDNGWRKTSYG